MPENHTEHRPGKTQLLHARELLKDFPQCGIGELEKMTKRKGVRRALRSVVAEETRDFIIENPRSFDQVDLPDSVAMRQDIINLASHFSLMVDEDGSN